MSRVVRQSKYRHVFGTAARKENCYDGLRITKSNWEGSTYCAVSPKFVAIIVESAGGGAFIVLPLGKTGRVDRDQPVVGGHKADVLDIKWCPHHDNVIASASEDCTVKVWEIPDEGLTTSLDDPICDLVYHQRRVGLIEWHPTASNILVSSSADLNTCLWDVSTGEVLAELALNDVLFSLSFSMNGEQLVSTCKDKICRVHNSRTLEVTKQGKAHDGAKAAQAVFLKDDRIFTTGFSRMSERQYALWDVSGSHAVGGDEGPLVREDIDSSNGVMFIFYDPDSSVVYLVGKGDSVIRYFEIVDDQVHWLANYSSNVPQRGMGYIPKRAVNVNHCEIARFYKLTQGSGNQGGMCEPISMTVPRKSELYQEDIYPHCFSGEPSITGDEWFTEGKVAGPQLMDMRELFADTGVKKAKVRSSVLTAGAKKPAAVKKPVITTAASASSAPAASAAPPAASSDEIKALTEEVKKLTATVQEYGDRIKTLEEKLAEYETTVLNANSSE